MRALPLVRFTLLHDAGKLYWYLHAFSLMHNRVFPLDSHLVDDLCTKSAHKNTKKLFIVSVTVPRLSVRVRFYCQSFHVKNLFRATVVQAFSVLLLYRTGMMRVHSRSSC